MSAENLTLDSFSNSVIAFAKISEMFYVDLIANCTERSKNIEFSASLDKIKNFRGSFDRVFDKSVFSDSERELFFKLAKKNISKIINEKLSYFENIDFIYPSENVSFEVFKDIHTFNINIVCGETLNISEILREVSTQAKKEEKYGETCINLMISFFSMLNYLNDVTEKMTRKISSLKDSLIKLLNHIKFSKKEDNSMMKTISEFVNKNDISKMLKNFNETFNLKEKIPDLLHGFEESTGANLDGIKDIFDGDITDIDSMTKKFSDKFSNPDNLKNIIDKNKNLVNDLGNQITTAFKEGFTPEQENSRRRESKNIDMKVDTFEDLE